MYCWFLFFFYLIFNLDSYYSFYQILIEGIIKMNKTFIETKMEKYIIRNSKTKY